jgi:diacylglycerol O-acyltransferase / wax synthase
MAAKPKLKPLSPMDAYLVRLETPNTHMHTASLLVLRRPDNAAPDFVRKLYEQLVALPFAQTPPFFYRLYRGRRWRKPAWEVVDSLDTAYHLRFSSLPSPGDRGELTGLVQQLHSEPLDFSRPLWQCHMIDGLADNCFAFYLKMHHALADGGTVVRLITTFLSEQPEPFSLELAQQRHQAVFGVSSPTASKIEIGKVKAMRLAFATLLRQLRTRDDPEIVTPYVAPVTPFDCPLGPDRTYALQSIGLGRLSALRKKSGATINDLVLAACADALRRYLHEVDALPERPLVVSVAVALEREEGHVGEGNEVAGVYIALPTHLEDGRERIAFVHSSMNKAKEAVLGMPKAAIEAYLRLTSIPFATSQMLGLGTLFPPYSNVTISNVPGPREKLYFHGARVEHMYPASVIFNRQALNITVRGCTDDLNIGVVACSKAVPDLQRLTDYIVDAVAQLETEFGLTDGNGS